MTAVVGIRCDGCETQLVKTTVVQAAIGPVREVAKARGWHKTRGVFTTRNDRPLGYVRDICPTCWRGGVR